MPFVKEKMKPWLQFDKANDLVRMQEVSEKGRGQGSQSNTAEPELQS